MADEDQDRKLPPSPNSPSSKLDALAHVAAAADTEERSVAPSDVAASINEEHQQGLVVSQQPSEVTPANTFESAAASGAPAASAAVGGGASALTASATATGAAAKSKSTKRSKKDDKDKAACPWKNRSDLLALWQKRYAQLAEYRNEFGDANVPQRYEANPELGRWVKDQRAFRRNNKLSKERIAMLDSLGFIWKLKRPDDFWTEKLDELKNYKAQFGNVNPPRDGEWKLLACWVDRQRRAGRKGKLTTERVRLLNEINFIWDPRGSESNVEVVETILQANAQRGPSSQLQLGPISSSESSGAVPGEGMLQAAASFQYPPAPMMGGPGSMQGMSAHQGTYQDQIMQSRMMQMGGMHMPGSRMSLPHSGMSMGVSQGGMGYSAMAQMQGTASFPRPQSDVTSMPGASMNMPSDMSREANRMTQGTAQYSSNNPSMMQGQATMGYMPDHVPPGAMSYNMGMSTSAFYPPQQSSYSSVNRTYSYPSINMPHSEERQASLSRSHQLRIMLAEEEERQASISRTQQLRAMLEEEERRLGFFMGRDPSRYEHSMYGSMEGQQQGGMRHGQMQYLGQQQQRQPQGQQLESQGGQQPPSQHIPSQLRESNDGSKQDSMKTNPPN